jgi:hypothetical protein
MADIRQDRYVLPVIQRHFVWEEEKVERLFDTLLKDHPFGGIIVIKEEGGAKPLFNFRPFSADGSRQVSNEITTLVQPQYFVLDGQQRLQSFYIGLCGSMHGKNLFFDLFSNYEVEYEFKFSLSQDDKKALPEKSAPAQTERKVSEHLWYPVKDLYWELKNRHTTQIIAKQIIQKNKIDDDEKKELIRGNIEQFYRNIIADKALGIAQVYVDHDDEKAKVERQRMVELFRRLNDGGTRLSGFDLVASILKGFEWKMEGFLDRTSEEFSGIGLDPDSLVRTIFILRDNHKSEMADIGEADAAFAIDNSARIECCLSAVKDFLKLSGLYNYYDSTAPKRSFVPLYFIIYHLFHLRLDDAKVKEFFHDHEINPDFHNIKRWLFRSLINSLFKGRVAGWVPTITGIRTLLDELKKSKGSAFPTEAIFKMYSERQLRFKTTIDESSLGEFDQDFIFYLIYNKEKRIGRQDVDHIFPKSRLGLKGYSDEQIWNIRNYTLINDGINRHDKNDAEFKKWIEHLTPQERQSYISRHLIPPDKILWEEDNFVRFLAARGELIVKKIFEQIDESNT